MAHDPTSTFFDRGHQIKARVEAGGISRCWVSSGAKGARAPPAPNVASGTLPGSGR